MMLLGMFELDAFVVVVVVVVGNRLLPLCVSGMCLSPMPLEWVGDMFLIIIYDANLI